MAKMKTEFEISRSIGMAKDGLTATALICNPFIKGNHKPYIYISVENGKRNSVKKGRLSMRIDKDLERFAVNILKALNSKRLKK